MLETKIKRDEAAAEQGEYPMHAPTKTNRAEPRIRRRTVSNVTCDAVDEGVQHLQVKDDGNNILIVQATKRLDRPEQLPETI